MKNILLFFILVTMCDVLIAQQGTLNDQVKIDLAQKNISEELIKKKLQERGFDSENITPDELPQYQKALDEIIIEIEEERASAQKDEPRQDPESVTDNAVRENSEEIKDRIDDGATIDEAIAEETAENLQKKGATPNIYGHHIFKNAELSLYRAADDISTPDTYILSTGDKIVISIFGASQADFEYTINTSGEINPANVGKVMIKGLTIREAKILLRNRFSRAYRFLPEQFSLVLKTARTVTINIFGEVVQPGSYTISAINTALNALMAAGGPKSNGSVRNIKLIKGSGETKILDVYDYLTNPKVQFDFTIDDQDIIYVPIAEEVVSIQGAIKRPMLYELTSEETLDDLIAYGGGYTATAYKDYIQVSRLGQNERVIIDVAAPTHFSLQDRDVVTVREGSEDLKRYVKALGEVAYPGEYEYTDGMSLRDLIDKAQQTEYTRKDIIFIFRHNIDGTISLEKVDITQRDARNIKLNIRDEVKFTSLRMYVDATKEIAIKGAVRKPNSFTFNPEEKIRISDLILLSGGLSLNANPNAILMRKDPTNAGEVSYLEVNVFDAISAPQTDVDELLQEGDILQIYTNERYNNVGNVSIIGQVRNPDTIKYDSSLSLKSLLLHAGGLKENANPVGIIKRRAPDNDVDVEYIRINLEDVLDGKDVALQRGDQVRVYDKNTYMDQYNVKIFGEVKSPGSFEYDEDLTVEDLVLMSGGLTMQAATNKVEIYRVDFSANNPTKILVKEFDLERQGNLVKNTEDIELEPFDIIIIRPVPDFDLQEIVYVTGEVKYPGPYIIGKGQEKLSDIIERAGGLQYDAFPEGASLVRNRGPKKGKILINLHDVVRPGNAHENIYMRAGDVLYIPKREDIVSIRTVATKASREYLDSLLVNRSIQMAYQGPKSAKWYIDNFAGGLEKRADKKTVRVIGAGGKIEGTRKILFWYHYPTVKKGSTIALDLKPPELPKVKEENRKPINWTKLVTDTMAIVSSAITIIALSRNL